MLEHDIDRKQGKTKYQVKCTESMYVVVSG